jgi:hypothetical protein
MGNFAEELSDEFLILFSYFHTELETADGEHPPDENIASIEILA